MYYTRETEQYAMRCDAMNRSTYCKNIRTWKISGEGKEVNPSGLQIGSGARARGSPWLSPELLPASEELGRRQRRGAETGA